MKSKKPFVQCQALFFQNTGDNLTAGFLKSLYTLSVYFAVVIPKSDDHFFDPHFYDQIGTGRCFPVMRTGFQVNIKHRFPEEPCPSPTEWLLLPHGLHLLFCASPRQGFCFHAQQQHPPKDLDSLCPNHSVPAVCIAS